MTRILEGKNRPTPSEAGSFVAEIEREEAAYESLKMGKLGEIAKAQAAFTKRRNEIYDDAKSQGVTKGVVKGLLAARSKRRKAQQLEAESRDALNDLEPEQKDYAIDIWKALGGFADSPLGAAAIDRETAPAETKDPVAAAAEQAWGDDPNKKPTTAH